MSMLQYYFEKRHEDNSYLFENLKIMKGGEKYTSHIKATVVEREEDTDVVDNGDIVSVKKIEGTFDLYGIVVEVRKGIIKYHIPLCELEVNDKTSDNYIKVDDYNFWFANR